MWALFAALVVTAAPITLNVGDRLPTIALTDQDGARVRVDALGGRSVLLSFVSTRR